MVCQSEPMDVLAAVPQNVLRARGPTSSSKSVSVQVSVGVQDKNISSSPVLGGNNESSGPRDMADAGSSQPRTPSLCLNVRKESFCASRKENVSPAVKGCPKPCSQDDASKSRPVSLTQDYTESKTVGAGGASGGRVLAAATPPIPSPSSTALRTVKSKAHGSNHTGCSSQAASVGLNPCIPRFEAEEAAAEARCPQSSCERDRESAAYIQQYLYSKLPNVTSDTDMERLTRSMEAVMDNCIFYPDLDSVTAKILLQEQEEGVFLIRNSSDPKFIFALSVKTERGATSVRIQYERGFFQLDCEERMKRKLPRFESVMELVDFHVAMCLDGSGDMCRWLETSGRKDMVVRLTRPRRHTPPSLTHLARLTVNQQLKDLHLPSCSTDRLPVPEKMKQYLRDYPYKV